MPRPLASLNWKRWRRACRSSIHRLTRLFPRVARHGIEAITVPPGNHARLAEAIKTLLRDPERRRCMGQAARLRATTQYSSDAFRKGIETVYRHAVTTKAASRSALASRPGTIGTGPENRHC